MSRFYQRQEEASIASPKIWALEFALYALQVVYSLAIQKVIANSHGRIAV